MARHKFGMSRHAEKICEPGADGKYDVTQDAVDFEIAKEHINEEAESLLKRIDDMPSGAIIALQASNSPRTEQTRDLFIQRLSEMLESRDDIEIVSLKSHKKDSDRVREIDDDTTKKYIIPDLANTSLLGFSKSDTYTDTISHWKETFKDNETFIGKLWAAHPDELESLHQQMTEAGISIDIKELKPEEFSLTPEEAAQRSITWIQRMKKIGEKWFPNSALYLEGISHNMRSDFTFLALLDEDICVESIDRVLGGKLRKYLEHSEIQIQEDGRVIVEYRGNTKEYSREEFDTLLSDLKVKIQERKKEWETE